MGGFNRGAYMPAPREPERQSGFSFVTELARPLLAVAVVGLVVFAGYKFLKSTSAPSEPAASSAQVAQIGQRLDDLEHRLDQLEKKPRAFKEVSVPVAPSPLPAPAAAKRVPPNPKLAFSRLVSAAPASASPDKGSLGNDSSPKNDLNSAQAAVASGQQQWEATADRLGNVVGELDSQRNALDSQRDALERDRARLDELAGRFARDSQPFTIERVPPGSRSDLCRSNSLAQTRRISVTRCVCLLRIERSTSRTVRCTKLSSSTRRTVRSPSSLSSRK